MRVILIETKMLAIEVAPTISATPNILKTANNIFLKTLLRWILIDHIIPKITTYFLMLNIQFPWRQLTFIYSIFLWMIYRRERIIQSKVARKRAIDSQTFSEDGSSV